MSDRSPAFLLCCRFPRDSGVHSGGLMAVARPGCENNTETTELVGVVALNVTGYQVTGHQDAALQGPPQPGLRIDTQHKPGPRNEYVFTVLNGVGRVVSGWLAAFRMPSSPTRCFSLETLLVLPRPVTPTRLGARCCLQSGARSSEHEPALRCADTGLMCFCVCVLVA